MLRLSMPTKTGVRGAPVFKYRSILICSLFSLFLFTASTTAIPIAAPVSAKVQERTLQEFNLAQSSRAGQPDVDHAISSGAQQSTVSKLLEIRGRKSGREEVLHATLCQVVNTQLNVETTVLGTCQVVNTMCVVSILYVSR
ncbi:hypothetical protein C8R41DRAFT_218302 [Lentinula lateritia]|uniref:Hydrophobin n=1 Tax=Lentinula lateritia TaxID=40482 RepID=A0ABQ8VM08_9AGAR|nr:hypothetical protein C8R41DRAFT_218302 [Lentinula lateritia]